MPMTVACPHCDANLKMPDTAAGKTVKCPKCSKPFAAPEAESPPMAKMANPSKPKVLDAESVARPSRRSRPQIVEDDDDFEDERPRRKRKSKKNTKQKKSPMLFIGIAVGVLVLIGAGVGAAMMMSSDEGGDNPLSIAGGSSSTNSSGPDGWTAVGNDEIDIQVSLPGITQHRYLNKNKPGINRAALSKDDIMTDYDKYVARSNSLKSGEGLTGSLVAARTPNSKQGSSQSELLAVYEKNAVALYWGIRNEVIKSEMTTVGGKQALKIFIEEKPVLHNVSRDEDGFWDSANKKELARIKTEGVFGVVYVIPNGEWVYLTGLAQAIGQPIPDDQLNQLEKSIEID